MVGVSLRRRRVQGDANAKACDATALQAAGSAIRRRAMRFCGKWVYVGCLALSAISGVRPAAAQEAVPAQAPAPTTSAPDIVRLKNGSLLRGTISELVAGETVTIVTVTGKTREIAMAEVEYAGPADRAPAVPDSQPPAAAQAESDNEAKEATNRETKVEPYVVREARRARLHLTSTPEGLTFHRQTGSAMAVGSGGSAYATGYERLCTAPCDISLPAGTEVLALSNGDEPPRKADALTFPAGESQVVGTFESRAGVRTAGWIILVSSVVVGTVMVYSSITSEQTCSDYGFGESCYETADVSVPLLLGGTLIAAAGIPLGIVLGVRRDVGHVELAERPRGLSQALNAPGLTLQGAL